MSRLARWLPPLALMGILFALSAQPDLGTGLGLIDLIGRKIAHAVLYGLLCFLLWRALLPTLRDNALPAALVGTVLYGISDEFHQSFVPGRSGSLRDVLIDTAGALVVAALIARRRRRDVSESAR